ncbi:hypothetical protein Dsin_025012 [Dipteronia sinensis]|uniref:Uncharacterized protein n=1 Tax=Dipteronia sinensis TaxID=43782 RepID=A0AAD9ZV20_9ROSI|nr:hypothetical protein Dsin_025012 [Dipteronia sinensis]
MPSSTGLNVHINRCMGDQFSNEQLNRSDACSTPQSRPMHNPIACRSVEISNLSTGLNDKGVSNIEDGSISGGVGEPNSHNELATCLHFNSTTTTKEGALLSFPHEISPRIRRRKHQHLVNGDRGTCAVSTH